MCPDWARPRTDPAPRISRSRMEMRNPLPRSVNSRIAARRFWATSVSIFPFLYMRNA